MLSPSLQEGLSGLKPLLGPDRLDLPSMQLGVMSCCQVQGQLTILLSSPIVLHDMLGRACTTSPVRSCLHRTGVP